MNTRATAENRRDSRAKLNENKRYEQIKQILGKAPEGLTAREITARMKELGNISAFDMNYVRPRLTEMVEQGDILENGKRYDTTTGRNTTIYILKGPEQVSIWDTLGERYYG